MFRRKSPEELTAEELRRLLLEKRRSDRKDRLERFRKTGRVVNLVSDIEATSLDDLRTIMDTEETSSFGDTVSILGTRIRKLLDGLLLAIEIMAVIGLGLVLFNGVEIIRELNAEVAEVLVQPTLTPTPLINAVVLPSGHTPPDTAGGSQYNYAEIPDHLRALAQSFASLPIPTPGPEQPYRITIPAIGVDHPVVQGDGEEQLKKGVGQHIGSVNPGQKGNVILSAHNDVYGEIFRHLDKLEVGDEVVIFASQTSYTYIVIDTLIVDPSQVDLLNQTSEPIATLISCFPYMVDNKRIVVRAHLQSSN